MKMPFLDANHKVVEREFGTFSYKVNGKDDPATAVMRSEPGQRSLVTRSEYKATVGAFDKLSHRHQEVIKNLARRTVNKPIPGESAYDKLSGDDKKQYDDRLKEVGLNHSHASLAVIYDHAFKDGALGKMNVYSVNNNPVPEKDMSPVSVSFYMGRNMYTAARYFKALEHGQDAATRVLHNDGVLAGMPVRPGASGTKATQHLTV